MTRFDLFAVTRENGDDGCLKEAYIYIPIRQTAHDMLEKLQTPVVSCRGNKDNLADRVPRPKTAKCCAFGSLRGVAAYHIQLLSSMPPKKVS